MSSNQIIEFESNMRFAFIKQVEFKVKQTFKFKFTQSKLTIELFSNQT